MLTVNQIVIELSRRWYCRCWPVTITKYQASHMVLSVLLAHLCLLMRLDSVSWCQGCSV